ncbi:MAG: DUF4760 domain-containing protein [Firmicutes bacterium]|nr:DUF4760 domain-containing protein [Bacillota bacterium]
MYEVNLASSIISAIALVCVFVQSFILLRQFIKNSKKTKADSDWQKLNVSFAAVREYRIIIKEITSDPTLPDKLEKLSCANTEYEQVKAERIKAETFSQTLSEKDKELSDKKDSLLNSILHNSVQEALFFELINFFESIGNGLEEDYYNLHIIKNHLKGPLIKTFNAAKGYINSKNTEKNSPSAFKYFRKYAKIWGNEDNNTEVPHNDN